MLFNSFLFFGFLIAMLLLYYGSKPRYRNLILLAGSYVFYGAWDWRFLSLIFFSTLVDYGLGWLLGHEERDRRRKIYLWSSISINLGLLGVFKYYNFFTASFADLVALTGYQLPSSDLALNIILPVGISFYTFQTISYTVDIYRRELKPIANFFDYALYVAFFPQLVAGPIERAKRFYLRSLASEKRVQTNFSRVFG